MSPQTIEMHFAQIMQAAESLTDLSKSLRALGEQELLQAVRENRACWMGRCADILGEKEGRTGNSLCAEADRISKIAKEMEDRARKMYQSEMMNIRLAATRIYS